MLAVASGLLYLALALCNQRMLSLFGTEYLIFANFTQNGTPTINVRNWAEGPSAKALGIVRTTHPYRQGPLVLDSYRLQSARRSRRLPLYPLRTLTLHPGPALPPCSSPGLKNFTKMLGRGFRHRRFRFRRPFLTVPPRLCGIS